MSTDELLFDSQRSADTPYLILEEHSQGFHNTDVHLLGKPAHIVVRLYFRGYPLYSGGLDHVWVNCALGQPSGTLDLPGVFFEGLDEQAADDLALRLGLGDPGKLP